MSNLDFIAAKHGQDFGKSGNESINDSLDILHRNGIYAMFLWLHENKGDRGALCKALNEFLLDHEIKPCWKVENQAQPVSFFNVNDPGSALLSVREMLTKDPHTMFFIKDLIDRMLTYARHMAKVKQAATEGQTNGQ